MRLRPAFVLTILTSALLLRAQDGQISRNTASVRGRIVFEGTVPVSPAPRMNADPYCAALPSVSQSLEDVIVYARPTNQTTFPVPASSVLLEHRDCRYVPHTMTMQAGQKLLLRNSDGTAHNVHAWPMVNMGFNLALARTGSESVQTFQIEELPVIIRDDVHNWQFAYVGVFAHPYHTVSRLNGTYEFKLPAGVYEIGVWHEKLGKLTQSFGVNAGEERELNFLFK